MTTGRQVLIEVLASEGVRHCFGNPGTTELPLIDELSAHPELRYILALQENVAVAMADGYAQASGRPSFVNLHTSAGLGGGVGNLTNALANRTPMVVTAGQQDRRHLLAEPILAGDLVGLAAACTKWQHEVRHLGELGPVLRRAFLDAASAPAGPVFVSIPMDVLDEDGDVSVPARSVVERGAVAGGLAELAGLLAGSAPDRLALVVGDEVAAAGALDEVVALA
ncbi:MAG: thiamine pyrophosphate-binding protein, partial [Acidimicrobiia bacterium]